MLQNVLIDKNHKDFSNREARWKRVKHQQAVFHFLTQTDFFPLITSFLQLKDLGSIALTCRTWRKMAWAEYCNRFFFQIITWTVAPQNNVSPKVALMLEKLFLSPEQEAKNMLREFICKCTKLEFTEQINLMHNLFKSLIGQNYHLKAGKAEQLAISLFNHLELSVVCKMEITELTWSMQSPILEQFTWNVSKVKKGLMPKAVQPFHYEKVSKNFTAQLKIHKDHTFYPGELVAIIERKNTRTAYDLYFGIIAKKSDKMYTICLQKNEKDHYSHLTLKTREQIGKFPADTPLPHFCL